MDLLPAAANLLQLSLDGWSDLRDTSGLLSSSHALLASEFLLTYSIRLVQIQVPLTHIYVSRLVFLLYPGLDLSCYLICSLQAVYNDFPTFASRHVYIFEMKGRADGYIH